MSTKVDLPAGTVLDLPADAWDHSDGPLQLRVKRVMNELSRFYSDRVWIEGERLNAGPDRGPWIQALVRTNALPAAARSTS